MNIREYLEANPPKFPVLVDSTMLNCFKACKLKFYREFMLGLTPRGISPHLHAGAAFATGIETVRKAYYGEGLSQAEAVERGLIALTLAYGDYTPPDNIYKTWDRVATALVCYFDEYPLDTDPVQPYMSDGKPAVEYTFALPIDVKHPETGDPILWGGRFDMLAVYHDLIYTEDEKTTSSLGYSWAKKWDLRSQFIGYTWAAIQHGFDCQGTIVRGVGMLKTDINYLQVPVSIPHWKVERWYETVLDTVEEMKRYYEAGKWPYNFDEACTAYGGCPFLTLCNSKDPTPWLEDYELRRWDPTAKEPSIPISTDEAA